MPAEPIQPETLSGPSPLPEIIWLARLPGPAAPPWTPLTRVSSASDLPPHLLLGDRDDGSFQADEQGWRIRYPGDHPQTFLELAFDRPAQQCRLVQVVRRTRLVTHFRPEAWGEPSLLPTEQYLHPDWFERLQLRLHRRYLIRLEFERYQAPELQLPEGVRWVLFQPVPIEQLRSCQAWAEQFSQSATVHGPTEIALALGNSSITDVPTHGRTPYRYDLPKYSDERAWWNFGFPVTEPSTLVNGPCMFPIVTTSRRHYTLIVFTWFRDLETVVDDLYRHRLIGFAHPRNRRQRGVWTSAPFPENEEFSALALPLSHALNQTWERFRYPFRWFDLRLSDFHPVCQQIATGEAPSQDRTDQLLEQAIQAVKPLGWQGEVPPIWFNAFPQCDPAAWADKQLSLPPRLRVIWLAKIAPPPAGRWCPLSQVTSAWDLPARLLLGDRDTASFQSDERGWRIRYLGDQPGIELQLALDRTTQRCRLEQTIRKTRLVSEFEPNDWNPTQALSPEQYLHPDWFERLKLRLQRRYHLRVQYDPQRPPAVHLPDGVRWVVYQPVPADRLRACREWAHRFAQKATVHGPTEIALAVGTSILVDKPPAGKHPPRHSLQKQSDARVLRTFGFPACRYSFVSYGRFMKPIVNTYRRHYTLVVSTWLRDLETVVDDLYRHRLIGFSHPRDRRRKDVWSSVPFPENEEFSAFALPLSNSLNRHSSVSFEYPTHYFTLYPDDYQPVWAQIAAGQVTVVDYVDRLIEEAERRIQGHANSAS